jgi:hypothetical protein
LVLGPRPRSAQKWSKSVSQPTHFGTCQLLGESLQRQPRVRDVASMRRSDPHLRCHASWGLGSMGRHQDAQPSSTPRSHSPSSSSLAHCSLSLPNAGVMATATPLPSGGAPPNRCCTRPPSQPSVSPPSPRRAPPRTRDCPDSRSPEHPAAGVDATAPPVHVVQRPRSTSGRASTSHGCGWTSWSSSHPPPPPSALSGRHRQPPAAFPAWRRR